MDKEQCTIHIDGPRAYKYIYSVMQSDGNSFYGDVDISSVIKTSRDENKTFVCEYVRIIIMIILILNNIIRKCILTLQ